MAKKKTHRGTNGTASTRRGDQGKGMTKTAGIIQAFQSLGEGARPRDVKSELARKGIEVSYAQITNVRARMLADAGTAAPARTSHASAGNGTKVAAPSRVASASTELHVDDLLEARRFLVQFGGLERLQRAVKVMEELQIG